MPEMYIIIVLLTVVGTVTVIILFYFILMCISAIRAPALRSGGSNVSLRNRTVNRPRSSHPQDRMTINARRQTQRRAAENVYMSHPTATLEENRLSHATVTTRDVASRSGHATLTIPSNLFLNPQRLALNNSTVDENGHQELEVLRFYTAEELANFPFEDHARQIANTSLTSDPSYEPVQRRNPQVEQTDGQTLTSTPLIHNLQSNHQSIFIRHPELVISPGSNSLLETRLQRHRLCYSIPASYIGRPPAYLPCDDQPPSYDDALRLCQIEDQSKGNVPLTPD